MTAETQLLRKIIHIDMDAFFASVEQRDRPELRGKPVVVGGQPGKRGVVAAASYEARKFGVRSAMPSNRAQQLCPHLVFLVPRFDAYREVSLQIREIFHEYTDLVEPMSLDEAYLDVTENKREIPSATWTASEIRQRILERTGLTASAGISYNKFLAKMASDINKPNGQCLIRPSEAANFLAQLPIGKFHGVGKATEKRMHELGIFTGADLAHQRLDELTRVFGKSGAFYHGIAHGHDPRPVETESVRKSIGVEETYERDLMLLTEMELLLRDQAVELARRLKKSETGAKTLTLKLRYDDFETHTRAKTNAHYIHSADECHRLGCELLRAAFIKGRGVRLLGLTASNLECNASEEPVKELQLALPFEG